MAVQLDGLTMFGAHRRLGRALADRHTLVSRGPDGGVLGGKACFAIGLPEVSRTVFAHPRGDNLRLHPHLDSALSKTLAGTTGQVHTFAAVGAVLLARELGDRLNQLLLMLVGVATSVGRIDFLLDEVDQGKVALQALDANFRAATERALDAI